MGTRLRKARENAGFRSARAAAERFGWTVSTYAAHENGQNDFAPTAAERYARAFKVSAAWLLTGEGSMERRNIASVRGYIGAGAEITPEEEQIPPEGLEEIEVPFPLPDGAIAFEVRGESMWPRYDDGDVIICSNHGKQADDALGWEAAVKTTDGRRYLKRILRGPRRGTYDLESHNAPVIRAVRLIWIGDILGVVRRGQWRRLTTPQLKTTIRRTTRRQS